MRIESSERPWGNFRRFTHNEQSTVKVITVNPDSELSLQFHHGRSEFWRILKGNPTVTIGDTVTEAHPGDEFEIAALSKHRIKANDEAVEFLEIAFGTFDENDIVRLEDKYGRS